MSDIDKILRDALQGHEVPYDSQMWDKLSSNLSPLEDGIRESVKDFEAPYNAQAWSAVKNQIGSSTTFIKWIAGSAAAVGLIAGAIAFIPSSNSVINSVAKSKTANNQLTLIPSSNDRLTQLNEHPSEIYSLPQESSLETIPNQNIIGETTVNSEPNNHNLIVETTTNNTTTAIEFENIQPLINPESNDNTSNDNISQGEPTVSTRYNADFSLSDYSICQGEEIIVNPKVIKSGILNTWDFGDGNNTFENATKYTYETAGEYEITHHLIDEKTNKILASSKHIITVDKLPNTSFEWTKDNKIIPTLNFASTTNNLDKVYWKIDGQVVSDKLQVEHTFREKGTHFVEFLASGNLGCENSTTEKIEIETDYNLLAPSAFTPNGDNINDEFIPSALKLTENEFEMTIFNQAGNLVYQSNSANYPWDGRDMNDNSIAPNAAYVWSVRLKNGNGIYENYKGQVFITR